MNQPAASRFPAVMIGGPPHSGKSVLAYSLKEALKKAGFPCYLLRAAPDGEGDWFHQADPALARSLRRKGIYTPDWVERICRDIAYRPLPFLVDIGGQPQPWQEPVIDQCTHAILLFTPAADQAKWEARLVRYNLLPLAILESRPSGPSHLTGTGLILHGTITHLERGQEAAGPVFEALLERVQALFNYSEPELVRIHQAQAPTDLVITLPEMYRYLYPDRDPYIWQPGDLPAVLDYLPRDTPLALYGSGPGWLFAAVARAIAPQPFYQFDARRGWVEPVHLAPSAAVAAPVTVTTRQTPAYLHIKLVIAADYLEYEPELALPLPPPGPDRGLILDGKLPLWLYTGLANFYQAAPWTAIYYPPQDQAVIVAAPAGSLTIGQVVSVGGK